MYVAPPFKQTLFTHIQNYLCAISKNSVERVLKKKILKGLYKMCYIQIVFGYYFYDNVGSSNISEFCSVVLEKKIFKYLNIKTGIAWREHCHCTGCRICAMLLGLYYQEQKSLFEKLQVYARSFSYLNQIESYRASCFSYIFKI